jgi:phosphohistidine swiveling domain-containing protein
MTTGVPPVLGTKARTLAGLTGRLRSARVLPLLWFSVERWNGDAQGVLKEVLSHDWARRGMIVRSSALAEDGLAQSMAGRFESVLGVRGREALSSAIDTVIQSFGSDAKPGDEVLVQPMLESVVRAGVAFTADPATGSPYRVIEWTEGPDTATVTAGKGARTYYRAKAASTPPPHELSGVLALLDELEVLFPGQALDVEFAEAAGGMVLLQARPLVLRMELLPANAQTAWLTEIANKVSEGMRPHPFLHGSRTIYGVMPDWNPAEIIGIRPRPLSLSLYRELITDAIWAYQRNNYGYKNLRSHPLLRDFHGLPYIDVRVCFNSFLPKNIESGLAERLVDYYLDRLEAHPELHDKVEFEIVYTCYSVDLPERLGRLREAGFSDDDCRQLSDSLRQLTNRIVNAKAGLWRDDQGRVETMAERRHRLYEAAPDPVSRIYWLLEDCKRYGTLPFAGLARAGFIAIQMLRSLVAVGVLDKSDHDRFINSLNTVSGQLPRDLANLDRAEFLAKYGHLRPGTYDILSPRYDEAPDMYFDWLGKAPAAHPKERFALSLPQLRAIGRLLESHGLEQDVISLFDFLQAGIELRESSKFEFTRNLSDALSLMADFGGRHGFSREDMAFANVSAFYQLHACSADPKAVLDRSIREGRERYAQTCSIALPPLIVGGENVWAFEMPATDPNFITQKRVTAGVVGADEMNRLAGGIVCIRSADPGYDWLFSHNIAGLITAYGGANSHMAIRANELGLPAVIGAGETNYQAWSKARRLSIDCANRKVEVLA